MSDGTTDRMPENTPASEKRAAVRSDWGISEMPKKHATFVLKRTFSEEEMAALRHGNIPQEMEDKWFWFMEGDTLYAHRSWTGICIYRIDFRPKGKHIVTVNRDSAEYKGKSIAEDRALLNSLLDWWVRTPYDPYGEWISETAESLRKAEEK